MITTAGGDVNAVDARPKRETANEHESGTFTTPTSPVT